jgi:hypothetical protein
MLLLNKPQLVYIKDNKKAVEKSTALTRIISG